MPGTLAQREDAGEIAVELGLQALALGREFDPLDQ